MAESSEHAVPRDLAIVLHNGHRYEMPYENLHDLMDYFVDPKSFPSFQFATTDGLFVYLQKNAIAAIETSRRADRLKFQGFAVIGDALA